MTRIITLMSRNIKYSYFRRGFHSSRSLKIRETTIKPRIYLYPLVAESTSGLNLRLRNMRNIGAFFSSSQQIHTTRIFYDSQIVNVPPFADSVSEGDIKFTLKVGDILALDDVAMEIETDKTTVSVPSPIAGVVEEIYVKDGDTVKAGQKLFKMKPSDGATPPATQKQSKPVSTATQSTAPPPQQLSPAASSSSQVELVKVPPFADSVSEGDVKFTVKVGDVVKADDTVMEIETDKTTVGVPAPFSGVIEEILVQDSTTVKAGQSLFKIRQTDGTGVTAGKQQQATTTAASPPLVQAPSSPQHVAAASPPPPPQPKPTAPVTQIPVAAIRHAQGIEAAAVKLPPEDYSKEITGTRTEQRVKMNRMRLKIAARLKEAQNTNAMLTTFNEIDMSYIMEFRKSNLDAFQKKYNTKIGFMSVFCKAAAYGLQDQPVINAVIDGNEIVYRDYVDISVAVATPKGLVVPVIRNVESMNYADIELTLAALGEKARKGQIAVEDMDGGTFTISNGGVFGSLMGTPIINPPQSSILGMHGIFDRPIAVKGQVVIRPMMYVALTYDHRLIDGREAVLFLRKIKAAVEDPRIMLAGL